MLVSLMLALLALFIGFGYAEREIWIPAALAFTASIMCLVAFGLQLFEKVK